MTAKEFLMLAWKIDRRIDRKTEERERIQAKLEAGRASNLSGMPRGGRYDWTDTAARVTDIDAEIAAEIAELCRIKREVNAAIDAVEDSRYRHILELRYRNYRSWEEIAEALQYDLRYVYRLHGKALLFVRVPDRFA